MSSIISLRPDQKNLTLTVKVVDATTVMTRQRGPKAPAVKVAECLVADSTGVIVFVARNEQVDVAQKGATITLKGAKVDMFRGSMRLSVDGGKVEAGGDLQEPINTSNNMSLLEFELVTVGAQ
ncbi:hypothetical protein PLESTB_000436400 [Pleodorina starrii]|uniref:Single-stranded DNA binding protein Ssb-like OB fold domain-containing protein n=1 Tax=Pleodorina starrii TaxID=330485 RepID=A0A9W6BFW4_9CHLO|nr:hypothetical protein PLESTM_002026400 [Pleodorina starrii]GLC50827.1 hypothetical protein PLESTB_000436400 [Pleodorina starrii]GLC73979.1 hypothetical protein PLESTF_001444100 [Pleodorina starrii]